MANQITVVGTVATDPKAISLKETAICTFRLASSERKLNKETGQWEDGPTNWFSVNAFRALATNASQSLRKGDRVIVMGKLRIKHWETEGRKGTSVDIDAEALGHELRWGTSVFNRTQASTTDPTQQESTAETWASPSENQEDAVTDEVENTPVPF